MLFVSLTFLAIFDYSLIFLLQATIVGPHVRRNCSRQLRGRKAVGVGAKDGIRHRQVDGKVHGPGLLRSCSRGNSGNYRTPVIEI